MGSEQTESVVTFLARLDRLGPLLVAIAPERPDVVFDVKGQERVCLELSKDPVVVSTAGAALPGDVTIMAEVEDFHRVLSGEEKAAVALSGRRFLLKGSMHLIARVFPLLTLAPPLYQQHLRDGAHGPGRGAAAAVERVAFAWAKALGTRLSQVDRAELLSVLDALARGVCAHCPATSGRGTPRSVQKAKDNPLSDPGPSGAGGARLAMRRQYALVGGSAIGMAVFRLGTSVDLVEVMGGLSDGIAKGQGAAKGAEAV